MGNMTTPRAGPEISFIYPRSVYSIRKRETFPVIMTSGVQNASFDEAYGVMHSYPSSGTRDANDGVPSRPTLARYSAAEVFGDDPFGAPISSESRTVLATLLKLAEGRDESVPEIVEEFDSADDLRQAAEDAVLDRYGSAEEAGFALTGSVNHSAAAIAAICAVSEGVDPIEAVRNHLDGETVPLTFGDDDEDDSDEE